MLSGWNAFSTSSSSISKQEGGQAGWQADTADALIARRRNQFAASGQDQARSEKKEEEEDIVARSKEDYYQLASEIEPPPQIPRIRGRTNNALSSSIKLLYSFLAKIRIDGSALMLICQKKRGKVLV